MTAHVLGEPRAHALLGDRPVVTLVDPADAHACLSVRLVRAGARWIGVVDDRAALLDRVRLGLKPGFVVHHDAETPTISGELDVRILDRAVVERIAGLQLIGDQPFGLDRAVFVEVTPRALALEPLEERRAHGAVPRT